MFIFIFMFTLFVFFVCFRCDLTGKKLYHLVHWLLTVIATVVELRSRKFRLLPTLLLKSLPVLSIDSLRLLVLFLLRFATFARSGCRPLGLVENLRFLIVVNLLHRLRPLPMPVVRDVFVGAGRTSILIAFFTRCSFLLLSYLNFVLKSLDLAPILLNLSLTMLPCC